MYALALAKLGKSYARYLAKIMDAKNLARMIYFFLFDE